MKDKWIIKVFILTFILAIIFGSIATTISNFNNIVLAIILLLVIFVGITFDMIGVSVLTSKEEVFHALASKKKYGAKECITLLRNSAKISSICNDVIGDICGILSGTLGATLSVAISQSMNINITITSILVAAIVSMLTVGGKAIGKDLAVKKSDKIVLVVGKVKKTLKIK